MLSVDLYSLELYHVKSIYIGLPCTPNADSLLGLYLTSLLVYCSLEDPSR